MASLWFATCEKCGAVVAVTLNGGQDIDNRDMHDQWHASQDKRLAPFLDGMRIPQPALDELHRKLLAAIRKQ